MSQQFILDCRYSSVIKVENIRVSNCIPFQLSQEKQNKIPYAILTRTRLTMVIYRRLLPRIFLLEGASVLRLCEACH